MGIAVGFVATLLALTSHASAITWDFSGTGGDLGTAAVPFTSGSGTITATAWTLSAGSFTVQPLFQRNEAPNDQGLGVCNSFDDGGASCPYTVPVPEPASLALMATGLAILAGAGARMKRRSR